MTQRRFQGTINYISHSQASKGYRHIDKDPMMDQVMAAVKQSGLSITDIAHASGVTAQTIRRWDYGKTRRPQHMTMEFVLRAVGKTMAVINIPDDKKSKKKR